MRCAASQEPSVRHQTVCERLAVTQQIMARYGMRFPIGNEFSMLRETFQPMIAAPITSNESVIAIHERTGQCVFVIDDKKYKPSEMAGSMLLIQLTQMGHCRLLAGEPLGHDIDPAWVCTKEDIPAALLVWGLLSKNAWYAGRVLAFSLALARQVYGDIAILTYAATPDGARIMQRVGFRPTLIPELSQLDLTARKGARHD